MCLTQVQGDQKNFFGGSDQNVPKVTIKFSVREQGCQLVYFQTQIPNLSKYLRVIDWNMLLYFMPIGNIFWIFGLSMTIGTFCVHLVYFSGLSTTYQEKSGNPV
jgi:hypothetical protein